MRDKSEIPLKIIDAIEKMIAELEATKDIDYPVKVHVLKNAIFNVEGMMERGEFNVKPGGLLGTLTTRNGPSTLCPPKSGAPAPRSSMKLIEPDATVERLAMKPAVDAPQKMSDPDLKAMNEYLLRCIAIARTHLEKFPDQGDHDVRYALGALEIDDPKWRERIYDPEIVADQRNTINGLHADIAKLEQRVADCSCEKWKACARNATGKCRICDGETYYIPRE